MNTEDQVVEAIARRDAASLGALIDSPEGREVLEREPSLLAVAVRAGCRDCIHVFLRSGVDANTLESDGTTALYWAVTMGDIEAVRILVHSGADPRVVCANGDDAISQARKWDRQEILSLLLGHLGDRTL